MGIRATSNCTRPQTTEQCPGNGQPRPQVSSRIRQAASSFPCPLNPTQPRKRLRERRAAPDKLHQEERLCRPTPRPPHLRGPRVGTAWAGHTPASNHCVQHRLASATFYSSSRAPAVSSAGPSTHLHCIPDGGTPQIAGPAAGVSLGHREHIPGPPHEQAVLNPTSRKTNLRTSMVARA